MGEFSGFTGAMMLLTFLCAGFVKGVIGLGLPTVAVGLLGLWMAPAKAASLLVVPSLVTNVWQLLAGPAFMPLLRRFGPMLAGVCAGTWIGAGWLASGNGMAVTWLGAALVVYALFGLSARRILIAPRAERWLSIPVGVATGMVTAATGVFVLPAVPYLQMLGLQKDELVQALGLSFTVSTIALGATLMHDGLFQLSTAGSSALTLLPALAGMFIGQRVRGWIRAETFRTCFFAGLLLLGAHLASRGLL